MPGSPQNSNIDVYLEVGSKRVFASAAPWPGWSRSGRTEEQALAALEAYGRRYAAVAEAAGVQFPGGTRTFEIVERLRGSATTDFGAPGVPAEREFEPLTTNQASRLAALLVGAWTVLDGVVAGAPAELRKGPRGGGRDRDAVFQHVVNAEVMYARKLGLRVAEPAPADRDAVDGLRSQVLDLLPRAAGAPRVEGPLWAPRYAVRRLAWHVTDHAWEIEDRT